MKHTTTKIATAAALATVCLAIQSEVASAETWIEAEGATKRIAWEKAMKGICRDGRKIHTWPAMATIRVSANGYLARGAVHNHKGGQSKTHRARCLAYR